MMLKDNPHTSSPAKFSLCFFRADVSAVDIHLYLGKWCFCVLLTYAIYCLDYVGKIYISRKNLMLGMKNISY